MSLMSSFFGTHCISVVWHLDQMLSVLLLLLLHPFNGLFIQNNLGKLNHSGSY